MSFCVTRVKLVFLPIAGFIAEVESIVSRVVFRVRSTSPSESDDRLLSGPERETKDEGWRIGGPFVRRNAGSVFDRHSTMWL